MALTVCLRCDKTYGETSPQCPHCGTHNFFCDDSTLLPAVHILCDHTEYEGRSSQREKLVELNEVREELLPHTRPFWKKVWEEHREGIMVLAIVAVIAAIYYARLWGY